MKRNSPSDTQLSVLMIEKIMRSLFSSRLMLSDGVIRAGLSPLKTDSAVTKQPGGGVGQNKEIRDS